MFFNKNNENNDSDFDDELGGSDYVDYNLLIVDEGIIFSRSYSYLIFSNFFFILLTSFWTGFWYLLIINTIMWSIFYQLNSDSMHGQGEDQASIDRWKKKKKLHLEQLKKQKLKDNKDKIKFEDEEEESNADLVELDIYLLMFYEEYGILIEDSKTIVNYAEKLNNYDIFYHLFLLKTDIDYLNEEFFSKIDKLVIKVEKIKLENLTKIEKNKIKNYQFKDNILYTIEDVYLLYIKYLDILYYLKKNNNIKYKTAQSANLSWINFNNLVKIYYTDIIEVYYRAKKKK